MSNDIERQINEHAKKPEVGEVKWGQRQRGWPYTWIEELDDLMETARLNEPPWHHPSTSVKDVPAGFVLPEPASMLPVIQAHLDFIARSLGLPSGSLTELDP